MAAVYELVITLNALQCHECTQDRLSSPSANHDMVLKIEEGFGATSRDI